MRLPKLLILLLLLAAPVIAFAGTSGPTPIPPAANFQIGTNVITVCKGVINYIPITVDNLYSNLSSPQMQDLQLSVLSTKSFTTIGNGTKSNIYLSPNRSITINTPVFVNLNSSSLVTAEVSINYNYDTLYTDSETRNISFGVVTCPAPLSAAVVQKVLTSGQIENLTLRISNVGLTTLNNIAVKTSVSGQDAELLTSQPIELGSLLASTNTVINESIFVYKNSTQTFPLNLSITLYNGTSMEQINYNIPVLTSGIINLTSSSLSISPTSPTAGGVFSISFVLTDIGTSGAAAVTATAITPKGITPFGSNSVYVGDVAVDSQTPVTITLTSNSMLKAGSYTIPIRLNYLNDLRENINTTIDVPVTLFAGAGTFNALGGGAAYYTHRGSSSNLIILVILIIIIIVLAVMYLRERKKGRQKK